MAKAASNRPESAPESANRTLREIEPFPDPVDGQALLRELQECFSRHVVADEHYHLTLALWVLFAHAHDCFAHSPLLAVTAPGMRSGKTTTLEILAQLVPRPLATNSMTQAIFRAIDKFRPTLIADEADQYIYQAQGLIQMLNGGFNKLASSVVRSTGENYEPVVFSLWSPKAIGLIGELPATLRDRSIVIRLRRRLEDERVETIDIHDLSPFDRLAARAARWVADHRDEIIAVLKSSEPQLPAGVRDREAQKWRPLLTIAHLAGGPWPELARQAAAYISHTDPEDNATPGQLLLADVAAILVRQGKEWISTNDLASALRKLEDRSWRYPSAEAAQKSIARMLRPFGVKPRQKKLASSKNVRGYSRSEVEEAARRNVPELLSSLLATDEDDATTLK